MGIIKELIDELSQNKSSLTDILIRTKVLAHALNNAEIKEWVDNELNGYTNLEELPSYRIVGCRLMGQISNGVHRAKNYPIPIINLTDDLKKLLHSVEFQQSISALEEILRVDDGTGIKQAIPPEFYGYLSKGLGNRFVIEYAQREVDRTQIAQMLTSIKAKLLDFLLDIDDIVDESNIGKITHTQTETIKAIFGNAVFGDNATILVGNNNTQTVKNINKGNFKELEKALNENGVNSSDINELKTIIDIDKPNIETKTFGNKVNEWITKMLSKALDGTWKVGIAAAGKLLADALWAYYGGNIQN